MAERNFHVFYTILVRKMDKNSVDFINCKSNSVFVSLGNLFVALSTSLGPLTAEEARMGWLILR